MKPALEVLIISGLGIVLGSTMYSIYRDNKNEFKQLQSSYDSLNTKYNELKQTNSELIEIAKKYNFLGMVISKEEYEKYLGKCKDENVKYKKASGKNLEEDYIIYLPNELKK